MRMQSTSTAADDNTAGPSSRGASANTSALNNDMHQALQTGYASGRQARSTRRHDRGQAQDNHPGAELGTAGGRSKRDDIGSDNRHGGAAAPLHEVRQQASNGRALRSRRVRVHQPDEAQMQSDDDVQLAQALQESMRDQPQPVRRSGRTTRQTNAVSHQPNSEEAADEAAGPSHAEEQLSPGSSRETRAQHRALRTQQMYMHETSPEPADTQALEADGHFVRRSQRQHTRASSASVEASHRALGAAQRAEGQVSGANPHQDRANGAQAETTGSRRPGRIKVTLRTSFSAAGQRQEASTNDDAAGPAGSERTGLRVTLRSRRS